MAGVIESFGVYVSTYDDEGDSSSGILNASNSPPSSTALADSSGCSPAVQQATCSFSNPLSTDSTEPRLPTSISSSPQLLTEEELPPLAPSITASISRSRQGRRRRTVYLMPSWVLTTRDPKIWMVLRKTLIASAIVMLIRVAYVALLHLAMRPTTVPSLAPQRGSEGFPLPVSSSSTVISIPTPWASSIDKGSNRRVSMGWSTSLLGAMGLLVLRTCLFFYKYMVQWLLYTYLQIVSFFWYNQLYRETWLVRKGYCRYGEGSREEWPQRRRGAADLSPSASHTVRSVAAPNIPWLVAVPLNSWSYQRSGGNFSRLSSFRDIASRAASRAVQCPTELVALGRSVWRYLSFGGHLVRRLLRHKVPVAPLHEWVLGDASAAAVASQRGQTITRTTSSRGAASPPPPTDTFATVEMRLESLSKVFFKAVAIILFSLFAAGLEVLLPVIGPPLSLLLNAELHAFNVFDYRYSTQQLSNGRELSLMEQLHLFEECWVYFAGYGFTVAFSSMLLTRHFDTIVSFCITSIFYSWQMVWCGFACPRPLPSSFAGVMPRQLPLFSWWFSVLDRVQLNFSFLWRLALLLLLLYIPSEYVRFVWGGAAL